MARKSGNTGSSKDHVKAPFTGAFFMANGRYIQNNYPANSLCVYMKTQVHGFDKN